MNTAGKESYFMPIMDDIKVHFTDDWGDISTDVLDWQIMLTFDFVLPNPFPDQSQTETSSVTLRNKSACNECIIIQHIQGGKHRGHKLIKTVAARGGNKENGCGMDI